MAKVAEVVSRKSGQPISPPEVDSSSEGKSVKLEKGLKAGCGQSLIMQNYSLQLESENFFYFFNFTHFCW
jgi:hypothetical protein